MGEHEQRIENELSLYLESRTRNRFNGLIIDLIAIRGLRIEGRKVLKGHA